MQVCKNLRMHGQVRYAGLMGPIKLDNTLDGHGYNMPAYGLCLSLLQAVSMQSTRKAVIAPLRRICCCLILAVRLQ